MIAAPAIFGTGYGLTISTALPLPGLGAADGPCPQEPDIWISDAALPAPVAQGDGPYRLVDDGLLFTAPGVGRYLARAGRVLLVDADPGADPDMVTGLLIATALPMLVWQRGGVLLHAASVLLPGRLGAVAIAGASGSGKSTVAAALLEAGGSLIADDSCWLRADGAMVSASGLPGGLFRRDLTGEARRFLPIAPARQCVSAPLAAIIVLDGTPAADGDDRRLSRETALAALLRHRHRPRIPAMLGQDADVFRACVLHSGQVPTYGCRPKDDERPGSLQDIIDFIMTL